MNSSMQDFEQLALTALLQAEAALKDLPHSEQPLKAVQTALRNRGMSQDQIAAVIQHHCDAQAPPVDAAEVMRNPLPRSNGDRLPKLRAIIVGDLASRGLSIAHISKIFRQPWTTTHYQLSTKTTPK